jgi:hypothetical protein
VRFSSESGSPFCFSAARERAGEADDPCAAGGCADDDADALGAVFAFDADGDVVSSAGAASIRAADGTGPDAGAGIAAAGGLDTERPAKEAAMTADPTGDDPTRGELAPLPGE